ncbi:sialate O-acetylesterase [Seonamhaeicola sp. MEBiC1930]|uniref:sialate O-acetylesterase n=1 Tax=Seonamhaeicola sp. MEBiC01930 TaxID=2976768 RepID=UPI0032569619
MQIKTKILLINILFFSGLIILPNICSAQEINMPSIFADHMVLQRGQKVPVWGKTDIAALVTVKFAGQQKSGIADSEGNWRIDLDAMTTSSESRIMTISSKLNADGTEMKISDVLVGEVWFAGGQSNMYRPFRMLTYPAREPIYEPIGAYLRNERDTAHDTLFRQFRVRSDFSVFEEKFQNRGNWTRLEGGDVNEFCATAYFFCRELRRELNVPVAMISCNLGATRVEPWIPMHAYQKNDTLEAFYKKEIATFKERLEAWDEEKARAKHKQELADWEVKVEEAKSKNENEPRKPRLPEHPNRDKQIASTLYNAMIRPMIPYAIKGALWYQGESNGNNHPEQYALRMSAMIKGWREAWGQEDLFFYYCQLANYRSVNKEPLAETDGWVMVQDQMRLAMNIPNAGMAVLNDIGEAKDIHPKNKIDAGKRLSLWALNRVYGQDGLVVSGPIYKSSKIKGKKVEITFDHVGSGLMVGKKNLLEPTFEVDEPLRRFQICGEDRQWKWAEAKIIAKDKVEVYHPEIPNPIEVRYAWSSNPEGANLYNKEGLPASLFKTLDRY